MIGVVLEDLVLNDNGRFMNVAMYVFSPEIRIKETGLLRAWILNHLMMEVF